MKKLFAFSFIACAFILTVKAQVIKTEADTLSLLEEISFPQASANMVFGFTAKMLDLNHLPPKKTDFNTLEVLLQKQEKDNKNVALLIDIYFAYKAKNEAATGFPYLQKAYGIAMELYEMNPSNLELVEQLGTMLVEVNRLPDLPALWKDYTDRNPQVAKGWAKLAIYQAQMLDTVGVKISIDKAFELDSDEPELYVAALTELVYGLILKMQRESSTIVEADLSFFKKALSRKPDAEMVKMGYHTAKLIELFYTVILNNSEGFSNSKSFVFSMNEKQKITFAELEKAFKAILSNNKISNKYIALKSLLLLEVLNGTPDMATAYLEESKKYFDSDAEIYKLLSFGYLPKRNFKEAIPLLKKATDLSPNYDDIFALARLYYENNETEKSKELLQNMLAAFPGKPDIAMGIISNLLKERKFEDACATLFRLESIYKEDIDLEKNNEYYLYYKAVCTVLYSKKTEEAKMALQLVIDKNLSWADKAKNLLKKFFK
jgi:tetratricopeptide (TPR) repeat protein